MAEGKWSQARRQKRKMREQQIQSYEREFLYDDDERESNGNKSR